MTVGLIVMSEVGEGGSYTEDYGTRNYCMFRSQLIIIGNIHFGTVWVSIRILYRRLYIFTHLGGVTDNAV